MVIFPTMEDEIRLELTGVYVMVPNECSPTAAEVRLGPSQGRETDASAQDPEALDSWPSISPGFTKYKNRQARDGSDAWLRQSQQGRRRGRRNTRKRRKKGESAIRSKQ